ncbi:MAG: imidazolonepropionase, partial [Deltaproteobacteria bacterium]|nr:imidazolonepropionase [Deltaproteobacteria bacterium]
MITKLFRNARIYTPEDNKRPSCGANQSRIRFYDVGALLVRDGLIQAVGEEQTGLAHLDHKQIDLELDCHRACLIPGFVDPHTHMCFARRREAEFLMRLNGMEYLEILQRGGGILSSVTAVREAKEDDLFNLTKTQVMSALRFGTTTLEIKSGYGLSTEAELKMLRVINRLDRETPLTVVPTFMGAHAVPMEFKSAPDQYVDLLVNEMMPEVARSGLAKFCDVFCEQGVFSVDQTRRILMAAHGAGMKLKMHADEVHDLGGAALAAELNAASADHLLAANPVGLQAMASAGVVAVLLPATAYSLRKPYAPARIMIESGTPVALATDCNPGSSYSESMPFVFGLAVMQMNLSIEEALTAATLNAAYALNLADRVGSLEPGKAADFLLLDGESPTIMAYHAGV